MRASTLRLMIRGDMEKLSSYRPLIEQKILDDENARTISSLMTRYNYCNFVEILEGKGVTPDFEIDDEKLKDFQYRIGHYLNAYAPGDDDLNGYITGISIYLVFIAHRPLHPPGLEFSNGTGVFEKDGSFYCSGKAVFIKDNLSLCKYCICKPADL
jgi:uncharacterized protein (UPF0305 family)